MSGISLCFDTDTALMWHWQYVWYRSYLNIPNNSDTRNTQTQIEAERGKSACQAKM